MTLCLSFAVNERNLHGRHGTYSSRLQPSLIIITFICNQNQLNRYSCLTPALCKSFNGYNRLLAFALKYFTCSFHVKSSDSITPKSLALCTRSNSLSLNNNGGKSRSVLPKYTTNYLVLDELIFILFNSDQFNTESIVSCRELKDPGLKDKFGQCTPSFDDQHFTKP